jgi:hypothetical protein
MSETAVIVRVARFFADCSVVCGPAIGISKIVSNGEDRHSGGSHPTRRDMIFSVARDLPRWVADDPEPAAQVSPP